MADIRPATEADAPIIRKMVKDEQLDPTSLDWRHFLIAEQDGQIIGIGQIKEYPGARELGSLVVLPENRGQGIASALINALEARSEFPLYLFCLKENETFYNRFDYQKISYWQAPTSLKLKYLVPLTFRLFGYHIIMMRKETRSAAL